MTNDRTHAWLDFEGSRLALTDAGEGPALLFVHVGAWSFIWRDLIARLAGDFRCVTFDAPGNGRTRDPEGTPVTLERASRALTHVVETLGLHELTLVAHDLGGPAGLAGAARVPERIRGGVAMNAFGWRPTRALRAALAIVGSGFVRELDVMTGLIPRISATPFGVGRNLDRAGRKTFLAGMDRRGRRSFHRYMRDAGRCEELYDEVGRALNGVFSTLPLLTIFGERNDPFGFQKQWKTLFPNARQIVVSNGNHFPMCDAPDLVASEIRSWHRTFVGRDHHAVAGRARAAEA